MGILSGVWVNHTIETQVRFDQFMISAGQTQVRYIHR